MEFNNATDISKCTFEFFPPENALPIEFTITLNLGDNHERTPLTSVGIITVSLDIEQEDEFDISKLIDQEDNDNTPPPIMSYQEIDENGILRVRFS